MVCATEDCTNTISAQGRKAGSPGLCRRCRSAIYYRENKEKNAALTRRWAQENPEKMRGYAVKHRALHADRERERKKKYREQRRAYALAHPEEMRRYRREWARSHPEVTRANNQRRRARLHGVVNDLTLDQWLDIVADQEGRCFYCGEEEMLQQEHKVPVVRGGGNTRSNVVAACQPCNSRKGTMTAEEFQHADDRDKVIEQVRQSRG